MFRSSLIAFLTLCSVPSSAQQLSADLSEFQQILGTWSCSGQNSGTPQSPAFEFESQFRIEATLGGSFVQVSYSETESSVLPIARDNIEYWQGANGAFTSTFFNSFGQKGELTSEGIFAGILVWRGIINTPNGPAPFEGRIEQRQPDQLSVEPTLLLPDGSEFVIARLNCRKSD